MFNPLSLVAPYDECQLINQLQAYNGFVTNDEQLDLLREIQYSGNYYWQGLAIPARANIVVAASQTINGTAVLPSGSYVTSVNAYASLWEDRVNPGGFKFKLFDKGTKASIFYGDYCIDRIYASPMSLGTIYEPAPSDPGMNIDVPFGPGLLMSPFIITGPGVLGWEIVNLATAANTIQLMLSCAVPINRKSVGQVVVSKG
jgi:hypothetical protein